MHQEARNDPAPVATDLGPLDLVAIAEGLGARGIRVATDTEIEPALRTALEADRPVVIQLVVDPGWVSVDQGPEGPPETGLP
jgi:thiamine pyrophosphate-dependent acetolactate synthase large subunit-like protein